MVIDKIDNILDYTKLSKYIVSVKNFIDTNNLSELKVGRYDIDGDNLFALVNSYETKSVSECLIESHKQYIDLQFIFKGEENIAYLCNNPIINSKPYDVKDDYSLFECDDLSFFKLKKGMFVMFFPNEIHMPGVKLNNPKIVKKIVFKISKTV